MGDPGIISNTSEVSQQVPKNNPTDLGSAENLGFRVDTKSVIIELRDQRFLIHCRDHPSTWYASKHKTCLGKKSMWEQLPAHVLSKKKLVKAQCAHHINYYCQILTFILSRIVFNGR